MFVIYSKFFFKESLIILIYQTQYPSTLLFAAMKFTFCIWILIFLIHQTLSFRNVTTFLNPGCECCKNESANGFTNLVYIKSEGSEDTLHHLWSTLGSPSLLLLQTSPTTFLNFTWNCNESFPQPDITFTQNPLYAMAVIFNKIWEYRDANDDGSMSSSIDHVSSVDMDTFSWQAVSDTLHLTDHRHCSAVFKTKINSSHNVFDDEKGLLSLELETQGEDGRSEIIPRLLYTSQTSQVRFVLDHAVPHFEKSRFAVEISIFTSENLSSSADPFDLQTVMTMDDEYTPGVFKAENLISKDSKQKSTGSYVTWKHVAYTTKDLSVTDSTDIVYYTASQSSISSMNYSVAQSFFMDFYNNSQGIVFNMSFGTSKDGFYLSTNYTQWSFAYGLGVPTEDKLSQLVIIVIASGLGLPLLLIILSSVYLIWHKRNMQKDDLLLGRN